MKQNRTLITVLSCCFIFAALALYSYYTASPEHITNDNPDSPGIPPQSEVTPDAAVQAETNTVTTGYLLILEGNSICGYQTKNSGRELLLTTPAEPSLISAEDYSALSEGISVSSYEELCMYFESYAS